MSGVNWMRAKSSPKALAKDRAIKVLPRPGRILQEDMARGQDADQYQFKGVAAPHHDPLELVKDAAAKLCGLVGGAVGTGHSCSNLWTNRASVAGCRPRRPPHQQAA